MIFPYRAMTPMTETVEWYTDVIESYNGTETRAMLRNAPRHRYAMKHRIENAAYVKSLLAYGQAGEYHLPLWHMAETVNVSIGATVIPVDTRYADYQTHAIIWQDPHRCVLVEIEEKTDSSITLTEPLAASYQGEIAPARRVKATDIVPISDMTGWISDIDISWFCAENYLLTGLELNKYQTYDVMAWPVLVDAEREFVRPMEWIDYGTGLVQTDSRMGYTRQNSTARIFLDGKEAIWNFRRWLHQVKGRVEPFWMPSYAHDVHVEPFLSTDTTLYIDRAGLTLEATEHLAFISESGIICRQVTDSAVYGDGEAIIINAALGFAGDMSSFTAISFLHLCRLGGDMVEFTWHRPDQVEVNFPVVML